MLSKADVERLLNEPSSDSRRVAATKIAAQYKSETLTADERRLAEDILGLMARDVEVKVRAALAENLKDYPGLARDIARTLVRDVEEVSLPVIRYSSVLNDEDLLDIVRTSGTAQQAAVAGRARVSARVADALAEIGKEAVVATLVGNEGADISARTYDKVLQRFADSAQVKERLVARPSLPVGIAERLVNLVSERLREQLVARHPLAGDIATEAVMQSRERATLGLLGSEAPEADVQSLVSQLHSAHRLTPSIILRALCMGDMAFFETRVAVLAGVPVGSARMLIHDAGRLGLPAALERAGLPQDMFPVFRAAVDVARETDYDGGERDRERFRRRMIERVLTFLDDTSSDLLGTENADYLLARLTALDSELARGRPAAN